MSSATVIWPFGHLQQEKASQMVLKLWKEDLAKYGDCDTSQEFKRYLVVRKILNRPVTMQSKEVDGLWHRFILDTRLYRMFCERIFGEYLDHEPGQMLTDRDFIPTYKLLFGEDPPATWFKRYSEDFDGDCA